MFSLLDWDLKSMFSYFRKFTYYYQRCVAGWRLSQIICSNTTERPAVANLSIPQQKQSTAPILQLLHACQGPIGFPPRDTWLWTSGDMTVKCCRVPRHHSYANVAPGYGGWLRDEDSLFVHHRVSTIINQTLIVARIKRTDLHQLQCVFWYESH